MISLPQLKSFGQESFDLRSTDHRHKRNFKRNLKYVVVCLLTLLLSNYLLENKLAKEQSELYSELEGSRFFLDQLDSLNKKKDEQKNLFLKTGWNSYSRVSWYTEQISRLIPKEITLTELHANPPSRARSDRSLVFDTRQIILKGKSPSSSEVNELAGKLESLPWIGNASISSYERNPAGGTGNFTITIVLT